MANFGVSLTNSSTSMYYNPAMLTSIRQNRVSASASNIGRIGLKSEYFNGQNFQSTPNAIVAVRSYSDSTLAYGFLNPSSISLNFDTRIPLDLGSERVLGKAKISIGFDEVFLGAGYAKKFSESWSWGVSFFLRRIVSSSSTAVWGTSSNNGFGLVTQSETEAIANNVLCVLGGAFNNGDFNMGISLFLPEAQLSGEAKGFTMNSTFVSNPQFHLQSDETTTTGYTSNNQLGINWGASYLLDRRSTIYASLQYSEPDRTIEAIPTPGFSDWAIQVAAEFKEITFGMQKQIAQNLDPVSGSRSQGELFTLGYSAQIGSLQSNVSIYYGRSGQTESSINFQGISLSSVYSY